MYACVYDLIYDVCLYAHTRTQPPIAFIAPMFYQGVQKLGQQKLGRPHEYTAASTFDYRFLKRYFMQRHKLIFGVFDLLVQVLTEERTALQAGEE
jgi:hypothetical protein